MILADRDVLSRDLGLQCFLIKGLGIEGLGIQDVLHHVQEMSHAFYLDPT